MNQIEDASSHLNYQLISEKRKSENEIYDSYGILLTDICNGEIVDISVFKDLTSIKPKATKLLSRLSKNQIKPSDAYDFIEDFLA